MNASLFQIALTAALFFAFQNSNFAQSPNVWRGGAAGHETDWSFFKNWSAGKTPSEFDRVVIPDVSTSTGKYPVIRCGEVEISSLEIRVGASLTLLPEARLLADDIQVFGKCKGCEERVLLEGSAETAAVFPKN